MKIGCFLTLATVLVGFAASDITVENELIKTEEIFNFVMSEDSDVWWQTPNATKYYCVYRNLWTKIDHPVDYPDLARVSSIPIYSSTKQYLPWLKSRTVTAAVEKVAESGFTDTFASRAESSGELVYDYGEGDGFFIDKEKWEDNYSFLPGIKVDADHNFLGAIAGLQPSPDWFTGFYLFDTIDEYDRTFFNRFLIKTYPWDAGTDQGETYTAVDRDNFQPEVIQRFTPQNSPNGIFVSPEGTVKPVAEFECVLHVCPLEEPDCQMENWPPANGCDFLKYPDCLNPPNSGGPPDTPTDQDPVDSPPPPPAESPAEGSSAAPSVAIPEDAVFNQVIQDFSGLTMDLVGVESLTEQDIGNFESAAKVHTKNYFAGEPRVTDLTVTFIVTNRDELLGTVEEQHDAVADGSTRQRQLEDSAITLVYTEIISYRTSEERIKPVLIAREPFASESAVSVFVRELQAKGGNLEQVTIVSEVVVTTEAPLDNGATSNAKAVRTRGLLMMASSIIAAFAV